MKHDGRFLDAKPVFLGRNEEIDRLIEEENNKLKLLNIKSEG